MANSSSRNKKSSVKKQINSSNSKKKNKTNSKQGKTNSQSKRGEKKVPSSKIDKSLSTASSSSSAQKSVCSKMKKTGGGGRKSTSSKNGNQQKTSNRSSKSNKNSGQKKTANALKKNEEESIYEDVKSSYSQVEPTEEKKMKKPPIKNVTNSAKNNGKGKPKMKSNSEIETESSEMESATESSIQPVVDKDTSAIDSTISNAVKEKEKEKENNKVKDDDNLDQTDQSDSVPPTSSAKSTSTTSTMVEKGPGEDGEVVGNSDSQEDGKIAPKKSKEEVLEFTKPTINQMKKDKKEKPLNYSEKITGREFEGFNDEITELNSGVQMLKHSYGSIIKSLVAMQNRRSKKKAARETAQKAAEGKVNFLTTLSTCNTSELKSPSCLEATDKYDMDRFLNPVTREETFNSLFEEVEYLNKHVDKLRSTCYDARGHFLRDKYEAQADLKIDRTHFNEILIWARKLMTVVDDIARNYNDDMLNMFRLS